MATQVRRPHQRVHAPKSVEAQTIVKPICCSTLLPGGQAGLISIDGNQYGLAYNSSRDTRTCDVTIHGYRLLTGEGKAYDVDETISFCDCPDSTYRVREGG